MAEKHLEEGATESDLEAGVTLFKWLKAEMVDHMKALLHVELTSRAKTLKITYKGNIISNMGEVRRRWKEGPIDDTLLEQVFRLVYQGQREDKMISRIVYETMATFRVWHIRNSPELKDKTSCLIGLVKEMMGNNYRGAYNRGSRNPHGVTLTISKKGGASDPSSNETFDKAKHVRGLDSDKYKLWLETGGCSKRKRNQVMRRVPPYSKCVFGLF